jgi:hypothetical protein
MKKILQSLDSVSTKPVEGADSMAKFLRVVKEADLNRPTLEVSETTLSKQVYLGGHNTLYLQQIVVSNQVKNGITPQQALAELKSRIGNLDPHSGEPPSPDFVKKYLTKKLEEGANPHKVTLPVQMAMQHYQQPSAKVKPRTRLIDKYFTEAEATILQKKQEEKMLLKQYAQVIAERVLMKENYNPNMSPNPGFKPTAGPGIMSSVAEDNAPDAITVDVPLMIRLMEYAREDASTDMDLHNIAEKLIELSADGRTLSMDDYESVVGNEENE